MKLQGISIDRSLNHNATNITFNLRTIKVIAVLSIISFSISAQSDLLILNNEKANGINYKTKNEIRSIEYIFPENIYHSFIDTTTNVLTVQLRGTSSNGKRLDNSGNLVLYDLLNKKPKWSKNINYQKGSIKQSNNIIIQTIANKSYCLNIKNGENKWRIKNSIYYIEPSQNTGIGYKYNPIDEYSNTLEGIDLTNGKSIWKREINREYGWNDLFHLNDSVIVIVAAGLHSINLKNGTGWDYNSITGEKDYTVSDITNAAGVALGVLTGTFVMSTGYNVVSDIVSNVLVDSSNIYFASKEKITKLNHNGQIIWSCPLTEGYMSKSSIFIIGKILYMVNKGYAFMGYRQLYYGIPFIAGFDITNGKQLFLTTIDETKAQINGYKVRNNIFYLVFKDRIAKYSTIHGSFISEKSFDIKTLGELKNFVGGQVYIKIDSTYFSLASSDSTNHYLFTKSRKTIVINDNLEIVNQIEYDQLYIYYLKTNDYKFLAKEDETTIINKENKKVAELKASRNGIMIGSMLYDILEKSFIETDLSELIKN
jgi:outer membrane protein assembly factor BamB